MRAENKAEQRKAFVDIFKSWLYTGHIPKGWKMAMWGTSNTRKLQASKFTASHREALERFWQAERCIPSPPSSTLGWQKVTLPQGKHSCLWLWEFPGYGPVVLKKRGSRLNHFTTKSMGVRKSKAGFQCRLVAFLCQIKSEFWYHRIPVFGQTLTFCVLFTHRYIYFVHTHNLVYGVKWQSVAKNPPLRCEIQGCV